MVWQRKNIYGDQETYLDPNSLEYYLIDNHNLGRKDGFIDSLGLF